MASILEQQIYRMEKWIRTGQGRKTRRALRFIVPRKSIPREVRAQMAALSWRVDLPVLGVKLLHPIVRPGPRRPFQASDLEKTEYGGCLINMGALYEGMQILSEVDSDRVPQAKLYQAFGHISQWDYGKAIPFLEEYLNGPLSHYERLVGRLNMGACYIYEMRFQDADSLLSDLREETSLPALRLLHGISQELSAINQIEQFRLDEAEETLDKAYELLRETESHWEFFVRKWKSIIAFLRNPESKLGVLHEIRQEALQRCHWETVRQCDEYEATYLPREDLLQYLYFGTPFESFRRKLLHNFELNSASDGNRSVEIEESYLWVLSEGSDEGNRFDPLGMKGKKVRPRLKPGQVLYRLLSALSSDFYRPQPLPVLYHRMYPDEFFNPDSSPARIYEAVKRLRQWFRDQSMPLNIQEVSGKYFLYAEGPCSLWVPRPGRKLSRVTPFERQLLDVYGSQPFASREVSERLKIPCRTVHRLLEEMRVSGRIQRMGKSRSTRYQLVDGVKQAS